MDSGFSGDVHTILPPDASLRTDSICKSIDSTERTLAEHVRLHTEPICRGHAGPAGSSPASQSMSSLVVGVSLFPACDALKRLIYS